MIQRSIRRLPLRALVVDDELGTPTAEGRAVRGLVQDLQGRAVEVVEANSAEDGASRDRVGLRDPRRADRLVARRRPHRTTARER